MKYLCLVLAALLVGCSDRTRITEPMVAQEVCSFTTGRAWVAEFKNFPEFPNYQVMGSVFDTTSDYCEGEYSDSRLILANPPGGSYNNYGITSWQPIADLGCVQTYTYVLGEAVLFPPGSEFEGFELRTAGTFCADILGCRPPGFRIYFDDSPGFYWHGEFFPVAFEDRNLVFTHRWKGFRAELTVNEFVENGPHTEVTAAHLRIWGRRSKVPREVTISHAEMDVCEPDGTIVVLAKRPGG